MSHWRQSAAETIAQVIADNPDANLTELEKMIRSAYPFGKRTRYPYKIWLDEVNKTMRLLRSGSKKLKKMQDLRNYWVS